MLCAAKDFPVSLPQLYIQSVFCKVASYFLFELSTEIFFVEKNVLREIGKCKIFRIILIDKFDCLLDWF